MIAAIVNGVVNRVVVTKLNRLSRNTRESLELFDCGDERDCSIVSTAESFDTGTPVGRTEVTLLMAFAELERMQISDRVITGKGQKAQTGGFNDSGMLFGTPALMVNSRSMRRKWLRYVASSMRSCTDRR